MSSATSPLVYRERPAAGEAAGLLVLHHGRGADEHDLLGLADVLDPERRLHVVTPGGPLTIPGWPGRHWYTVPRVGYPDPDTFWAAHAKLSAFHDDLWARTGLTPEQTVFGGFSMGSVMSYALGLDGSRPAPAGILAFSGFVPTVEGFELDLDGPLPRVAIGHGVYDDVIGVEWGRQARDLLTEAGAEVLYREYPLPHAIDPRFLAELRPWLAEAL
jgi:phospholipase/carboxylesterase